MKIKNSGYIGIMIMLLGGCATDGQIDSGSLFKAGLKVYNAETLSDKDINKMSLFLVKTEDKTHKVATPGSYYTKRLTKITQNIKNDQGLNLTYKVYLTKDKNAVCYANGSIRVYSGLMDILDNQEMLFVLEHEIAHAKLKHTQNKMKFALGTSAVRDVIAAGGNEKIVAITQSQLGDMAEKFINAQYSQSEESEADAYAVTWLQTHHGNPSAGIRVMNKFAKDEDKHSWLSDHPASLDRAERIQKMIHGNTVENLPGNDTTHFFSSWFPTK